MATTLTIRDRAGADDERIAELALQSITFHVERFADLRPAPSPEWVRGQFAELLDQDPEAAGRTRCRVAEREGVVVGFLTAVLRDAPEGGLERFDGPLVYVSDVAVDARVRRQGVGRALMDDAEGWARERGACALTLNVRHGNPARSLYEELGYHPTWQTYRKNL